MEARAYRQSTCCAFLEREVYHDVNSRREVRDFGLNFKAWQVAQAEPRYDLNSTSEVPHMRRRLSFGHVGLEDSGVKTANTQKFLTPINPYDPKQSSRRHPSQSRLKQPDAHHGREHEAEGGHSGDFRGPARRQYCSCSRRRRRRAAVHDLNVSEPTPIDGRC